MVVMPPCSTTVTRKDSTLLIVNVVNFPKPRSISSVTTKTLAVPVTLELGLVLEEILIKPTHVQTKLIILQIIAINILRQWDIFWCIERKLISANLL